MVQPDINCYLLCSSRLKNNLIAALIKKFSGDNRILLAVFSIFFILAISQEWAITVKIFPSSCIIIVRDNDGRLGNNMFIYASAFGLAKKHGCQMYVGPPIFHKLSSVFRISPTRLLHENATIDTIRTRQIHTGCTHKSLPIVTTMAGGSVELTGYWQSYKYFHHCWEDILRQFTFQQIIMTQLAQKIRSYPNSVLYAITKAIDSVYNSNATKNADMFERQKNLKHTINNISNKTFIALHIRRGDFFKLEAQGFSVSSLQYIMRGMSFFCQKHSNCWFLIASDDKNWCRSTFRNFSNVIVSPDNLTPFEDMALLSLCQHALITTGTFGWWSAMLTQGMVVCDASYPRPNSWLSDRCPVERYIPPWFKRL